MAKNIFCTRCGSDLDYQATQCQCGFIMPSEERRIIGYNLETINNSILIDEEYANITISSFEDLLNNYQLSSLYFTSGGAKKAYEKKVDFLKSDLLPKIENWREIIQISDEKISLEKVELFSKIYGITELILKEYFGPFTIKENNLEVFTEFRDFSRYQVSTTVLETEIDFTDIKTTNLGTIGHNILDSVGNTLDKGSFKELSKKTEWSDSDVKRVKAEVGVAIAGELIVGIGSMISQTQDAIKNVRIADNELNCKLEKINDLINSLSIEENEIEKQKRLYDKCNMIIDSCYERILKPIFEELNNDPVYIEYRDKRIPFDLEQERIKMDDEALNENVSISFWGCLLNNNARNYRVYWKKRIKKLNKLDRYSEITSILKSKRHKTIAECSSYKELKLSEFKDFEMINRRVLKSRPIISNNKREVIGFAQVFNKIKYNINNS